MHRTESSRKVEPRNLDSSQKKLSMKHELSNQKLIKRGLQIVNEDHRLKTILKEAEEQQTPQSKAGQAQDA